MAVSSSVEVNDYQFKSCILCQKSGLLTSGRKGGGDCSKKRTQTRG
jgi:hypothetical protein